MTLAFDSFVLAASSADLGAEPAAREAADCIEFRMDLAEAPLDALAAYDGELPVLATNRAEWEGGNAAESGRLDALAAALEHDAVDAIDVELDAIEGDGPGPTDRVGALVETAEEEGVSVVVSTHDFESTPAEPALAERLRRAADHGDVAKAAVTASTGVRRSRCWPSRTNSPGRASPSRRWRWGPRARHTRAVAPVYGSKIGYAPVDPAKATAPGQYDLETLRALVDRLSGDTA